MNTEKIETFLKKVEAGQGADSSVYFLGTGGIGMSALARYFNSRGVRVSGYDKTATGLTRQLEAEGIRIHYEDNPDLIDKDAVFVVYTPAIPKDHNEYQYLLGNGYDVLKRSQVLGMITGSSFNVCVAGTHGKTTTSTMVAHLLRHSGKGCNAFLGGIASNYDTNFWSHQENICVAEADEYDRSFLQLRPDIAVITAIDPDHLDIYGDPESFSEAFVAFSSRVKENGLLLLKEGIAEKRIFKAANILTYGVDEELADCRAIHVTTQNGSYHFDVVIQGKIIDNIVLNMGGMHNVENAVAAITVASQMGISDSAIRAAVADFKGVKRRFEYILKNDRRVYIDDYAHHPTELNALISGARGLFPGKKFTVVFQPHLYSRTRDFADGFAQALSLADEVILLPIYPAREKPIQGVESEMVLGLMKHPDAVCCTRGECLTLLQNKKNSNDLQVLITAGAGDIDTMVDPIKQLLEND